ncbi:hypothetical protein KG091_07805 [Carnobacteriaceae bacterium zg-ZUI78]|nr:hypothetical protein [Carnobacteriaceae bacterium zg-ZUI78]
MKKKYFFIKTKHPKIVRYFNGVMEVYSTPEGWMEREEWYDRLFFGDFSDYEEVTETQANTLISKLNTV